MTSTFLSNDSPFKPSFHIPKIDKKEGVMYYHIGCFLRGIKKGELASVPSISGGIVGQTVFHLIDCRGSSIAIVHS